MFERRLRVCDVCNQADDHPHHDVGVLDPASGSIVTATSRHMDCCASQGCDVCAETEQAYGTRRGLELIDHLAELRQG